MKLYGGIDLHSNNCVVVLLDEEDHVVYEERLSNDLGYLLLELAPYQEMIEGIVVESTFNWYWLVDGLMEAGYPMHLANTAAIQQYSGLKYTDDRSDVLGYSASVCDFRCCPKGISIRRRNGRCGTCCASAVNWCARR